MKKILIGLVIFMSIFIMSGCGASYTNISPSELDEMLQEHPEYQYLDVREAWELTDVNPSQTGYIAAFENIPLETSAGFEEDHSLLDHLDKDVPVVIICNSGNRSVTAAYILLDLGFTTVYNVEPGIVGWIEAGYRTEN